MTPPIRTRPDGTRYPIEGGRGGGGVVAAVLAAVVLTAGGVAAGGSGVPSVGAGDAVINGVPGNLAGDVTDALPGRDLATRRTQARSSAREGRSAEAWARLKLKQLTRRVEHAAAHELDCVAASTGRVRAFLVHTPCTSLDRVLLTVGDGHGNAAIVSVVRIGFRTAAQAGAFQQIEDTPGSGDLRPLDIAAFLHLTGVGLTARHYYSRLDDSAVIVAEADAATGHLDPALLDATAEVASYLPVT